MLQASKHANHESTPLACYPIPIPLIHRGWSLKNKASTLQQVSADLAERAGGLMRLDAKWVAGWKRMNEGVMQGWCILAI